MLRKRKLEAPPTHPTKPSLAQELAVIYREDQKGQAMDFTKLEVKKPNTLTRVLIGLLIALAILGGAAWGGFLLWQNLFPETAKTLSLQFEGPNEVKSGEQVQFDIVYGNQGEVPLASLEIKLIAPAGFTVSQTEPAPTAEPYVWTIGSMLPGSDNLIRLRGTWIDAVPSGQNLQAIATYRPANFNADFQDIATKTVAIAGSVLNLTVVAPTSTVPGSEVSYPFTLKNTGAVTLNDLRLRLTVPDTFLIQSTDPAPLAGATEWALPELAPRAEATVTVVGSYAADGSGLYTLTATAGIRRDDSFLTQTTVDAQTDVLGGGLGLRLIVNGSTDDQMADFGETLRLSLDVVNGGDQEVGGLSASLNLSDSSAIDWDRADLAGGIRSGSGNIIIWKSEALSKLGLLANGDRETIDFSLPLIAAPEGGADSFSLTTSATVTTIGGATASRTVVSSPLIISLNSDTNLTTIARYYEDGTPVGTGPLPPKVGQTTSYRVEWTIENTLHALDEVLLTTTLPPNVNYLGDKGVDIGTLTFDQATRVLSWTIERLPTSITSVSAAFDLSITPTADDVGKFVKLTNENSLLGTDSKTGSRLTRTHEVITTDLTADPEAAGKGAVVE